MKDTTLQELVAAQSAGSLGTRALLLAVMLASYVAMLVVDLAGFALDESPYVLTLPWETSTAHKPNSTDDDPSGWGDLIRMAGLPVYDEAFAQGDDRRRVVVADERGYRNSGDVTLDTADVIVTGASFFNAGSSNERTFPSLLAAATGLRVYNATLPGHGPVNGVLRVIEDPGFGTQASTTLVWGIVERGLVGQLFNPGLRALNEDGSVRRGSTLERTAYRGARWARWHLKLAGFLRSSSRARTIAAGFTQHLPPMSFDQGRQSPAALFELTLGGTARPVLVLRETLHGATLAYGARGEDTILAVAKRVRARCEAKGVRLVMAFAPDKLSVWRENLGSVSRAARLPNAADLPETPASDELAARLREAGIPVVHLRDALRRHQAAHPDQLVFRVDDTHWSDVGIAAAADAVADQLR